MLQNSSKKHFRYPQKISVGKNLISANTAMLRVWTFLYLWKLNRKTKPICQKSILAKLLSQI